MLIHLSFRNRLNSLIHYLPLLSRSRNGGKTLNIHQTYIPPGNMINVNVNTCIYLRCLVSLGEIISFHHHEIILIHLHSPTCLSNIENHIL